MLLLNYVCVFGASFPVGLVFFLAVVATAIIVRELAVRDGIRAPLLWLALVSISLPVGLLVFVAAWLSCRHFAPVGFSAGLGRRCLTGAAGAILIFFMAFAAHFVIHGISGETSAAHPARGPYARPPVVRL